MLHTAKRLTTGFLLLCFVLLSAPLLPPVATRQADSFAARGESRRPVRAPRGMVASTDRIASEIGVEIMRRGGNAIDAAIAVGFALAVTYPEAGNIGGGGFMLIRLKDGRTTAIDYREMAPGGATRTMYQTPAGELIRGEGSSTVGYRASGVPGTVAGMEMALARYGSGRLTWTQLIEPARRLAAQGFPVSYEQARSFENNRARLERYPESRRIFLRDGNPYRENEILRQPELAATLTRLQRLGAREFYTGETARLIASDMQRNRGLITLEDLRRYEAKEREPVRGTYRGQQIISMSPPSSGGIALLQMLNLLEGYNMRGMGWSSSERYHVTAEAMRRAFADRAEYLGDPDFARIPVAGLIDKAYAERLRAGIDLERATPSAEVRAGRPAGAEPTETTHYSVIDAEGNVVSNTYTINDLYGSGVTIRGAGIVMNDEMDDFTSRPGTPNLFGLIQGERNAIEPRKRPLSSMTPTIVLRQDGSFWFAVGARGGPRIITAVFQIVTNIIDYDMTLQQAIDAPRIHHQWLPDELLYEPYGLSTDTMRALEARGHRLTNRPIRIASAEGIMAEAETGVRLGASDPRTGGVPVGY